jgi:predicted TIM-barrel enzyme
MQDIDALESGLVDGLIIENAWDLPFSKPEDIGMETVASMSAIIERIKKETKLPIGINCLANRALQALAVAKATDLPLNVSLSNGVSPLSNRKKARILR